METTTPLKTADECEAEAAHYEKLATIASQPDAKRSYQETAVYWRLLAGHKRRTLELKIPDIDVT